MKIRIIITFILLLAVYSSFAQEKKSTAKFMSLGPVVGLGHSWINNGKYPGGDKQLFKPVLQLGVSFIYSRKEHWGFGGDGVISHEGYKSVLGYPLVLVLRQTNPYANPMFEHLTIHPVYVRIRPKFYYFFGSYRHTVRPKVVVGPSVGYKLDEIWYIDEEKIDKKLQSATGEIYKKMDVGGLIGVGLNIRLTKSSWFNIDGNYYHGFMNVSRHNGFNIQNRHLKLTAGVMLGI